MWSLAKRALANSCPRDVEELVEDVILSINAIRGIAGKAPQLPLAIGVTFYFVLNHCVLSAALNSAQALKLPFVAHLAHPKSDILWMN